MIEDHQGRFASQLHGSGGVQADAPKRTRWGWLRWGVKRMSIGLVVGGIVVGLIKFFNDPVVSPGSNILAAGTPAPKVSGLNNLTGLAVQLDYPAIFDEIGRVNNDASAVEQYNISSKAEYRRTIAISVHQLPSGHLTDDSNFKYRSNNPALYSTSSDKINGEPVVLMTKNDHTERTLFWAHGGRLVIVAITSTAMGDNVNDFMATVMPTVRWRT